METWRSDPSTQIGSLLENYIFSLRGSQFYKTASTDNRLILLTHSYRQVNWRTISFPVNG